MLARAKCCAQDDAGHHVAECQEDWLFKAIIGQQIFMHKQKPNVATEPGKDNNCSDKPRIVSCKPGL